VSISRGQFIRTFASWIHFTSLVSCSRLYSQPLAGPYCHSTSKIQAPTSPTQLPSTIPRRAGSVDGMIRPTIIRSLPVPLRGVPSAPMSLIPLMTPAPFLLHRNGGRCSECIVVLHVTVTNCRESIRVAHSPHGSSPVDKIRQKTSQYISTTAQPPRVARPTAGGRRQSLAVI